MNEISKERIAAIRLYRRYHPGLGDKEITDDELIEWLMERNGILFVVKMNERLAKIDSMLNAFGQVDPDGVYKMTGAMILEMRALVKEPYQPNQ